MKEFLSVFYQAIPLRRGQLSGQESIFGARIARDLVKGEGLFIESF